MEAESIYYILRLSQRHVNNLTSDGPLKLPYRHEARSLTYRYVYPSKSTENRCTEAKEAATNKARDRSGYPIDIPTPPWARIPMYYSKE